MAAVPASPHNPSCQDCGKPLTGTHLARHVCPSCGAPQSVSDETYFIAFGIQQKFSQDPELLRKRFYELSRALHPDRFTTSDAAWKQRSLERMSFLNEAYRTLLDPLALREYILSLCGFKIEGKSRGKIPVELAESWFDLQDTLSENPEAAAAKVQAFQEELQNFRKISEEKIRELESQLDSLEANTPEYQISLEQLSRLIDELSYLASLARDVQRLASRSAS